MGDGHRVGSDPDLGDVAQADVAARGGVDQQGPQASDALPGGLTTPDDDVEDLLLLVQIAHGQPGDERARLAPDVARPQTVLLGLRQVDLDLHRRLADLRLDLRLEHSGDRAEHLGDVIGGVPELGQIVTVDAYHEVVR